MATLKREIRLVMVDATENNNKIWVGKLFDDDSVRTEWGRVGAGMQSKDFPSGGEKFLESKKKEKENKGYREIQSVGTDKNGSIATSVKSASNKDLEDIAISDICPTDNVIKDLVKFLVAENRHQIHQSSGGKVQVNTSGLVTTVTGDILAKTAVEEAKDILSKMEPLISKSDFSSKKYIKFIQDYLMLVPQSVSAQKGWHESFFNSHNTVQKQFDFLDQLDKSIEMYNDLKKQSATPTQTKKQLEKIFKFTLKEVSDKNVIAKIVKMHDDTKQKMHTGYGMKVKRVYEVDHQEQSQKFALYGAKLDDHRDLFHGSSSGNWLSILKSGLKITPPSTSYISGKAFAEGIYFASQSTKSLNYAIGYWGGGKSNRVFLSVNQVAMGKYQIPPRSTSSRPDKGYDSYWAKPGSTSNLINDEMIIFNEGQYNPKYLVEFEN